MISWILAVIIAIWCLVKRFREGGRVSGYPLGMPRGTVRAYIAIIVVVFPFNYLIVNQEIPRVITSAIFILVAFYFETRKTKRERLSRLIHEVKHPEEAKRKEKYPLYIPKYSVRSLLVLMLASILYFNFYGPNVPFEITNTLIDIFLVIIFFTLGSLFRRIGSSGEEREFKEGVRVKLNETPTISDIAMIKYLEDQEPSWIQKTFKNFVSILTLFAILVALAMYTIGFDYDLLILPLYAFTVRSTLFLMINVYYGFRE
jgi:hypothetical protein